MVFAQRRLLLSRYRAIESPSGFEQGATLLKHTNVYEMHRTTVYVLLLLLCGAATSSGMFNTQGTAHAVAFPYDYEEKTAVSILFRTIKSPLFCSLGASKQNQAFPEEKACNGGVCYKQSTRFAHTAAAERRVNLESDKHDRSAPAMCMSRVRAVQPNAIPPPGYCCSPPSKLLPPNDAVCGKMARNLTSTGEPRPASVYVTPNQNEIDIL